MARAALGPDRVRDVRVEGDTVTEIEPRLAPRRDEEVLDARACVVLPGLHDHHVHLRALAAAHRSVDLRDVADPSQLARELHEASTGKPAGTWVRAVGYHESIAGPLDRVRLDELSPPGTPVRVQHRSGVLWVLNSAALGLSGLSAADEPGLEAASGLLWRRDDLVGRAVGPDSSGLDELGPLAAARGVTGFTDATPGTGPDHARILAADLRAAGMVQALQLMAPVGALEPEPGGTSLGPVKVLLDDHSLPSLAELEAAVAAAHGEGRAVAVHCVTRVQLVLALAALDGAGARPGDRIEHASVVPAELVGELARLGLTVVTQPHFVAERGDDYLRDVDPADQGDLYRLASLLSAGVATAAGTDAPFGAPDPWASMAAAMRRRTASGREIGPHESVGLDRALSLYLGELADPATRRTVAVGCRADLCVLAVDWPSLAGSLADGPVRATLVAGVPVFLAD